MGSQMGSQPGWESLFAAIEADFVAEFEAADAAELAAEVEDRTRRELARVRLIDRLRAALGAQLSVGLYDGTSVTGPLTAVGPDWLLVAEPPAREALVPLSAVTTLAGLGRAAEEPERESQVEGRLGLRHALRLLARSRATVTVSVSGGRTVTGTVDRVGADWVEIAEHAALEGRRRDALRGVRVLPFAALTVIRSV